MRKNLLKLITVSFLFLIPVFTANAKTLEEILTQIKDTLRNLGYVICAIFMMVGGYQMITASGDPQKFDTGKRTLLFAAIGFIIILAADKIVDFLRSIVQ
jgi:type IV secretory pathway VirB2 component (pilin)